MNEKALIVEDDFDIQSILKNYLEDAGYRIGLVRKNKASLTVKIFLDCYTLVDSFSLEMDTQVSISDQDGYLIYPEAVGKIDMSNDTVAVTKDEDENSQAIEDELLSGIMFPFQMLHCPIYLSDFTVLMLHEAKRMAETD